MCAHAWTWPALIMDGNRRWARQMGLASPSLGRKYGLRARAGPPGAGLGVAGRPMSPGLRAMNDQAAAAGPFAKAARLLENLAGVRLTVKRVERAAEASGTAAAAAVRDRAAVITARTLVPSPTPAR